MRALTLLAIAMLSTPALAGWSDFSESFPALACSDGWASCMVDGQRVGGDLVRTKDGYAPADLRVDWFSLQALPAFSPYEGLSVYTGPRTDKVLAVVDVVDVVQGTPPPPVIKERRVIRGTKEIKPIIPDERVVHDDKHKRELKHPVDGLVAKTPSPGAECPDIASMTPRATLGKLNATEMQCLEDQINGDTRMTTKDKASRPLLVNAWAKSDRAQWAKLMKRHLDEIDRSDPDLSRKYAVYLDKQGPSQTSATIYWADNAFDNRTLWSGSTYVKRTHSLHRLRSRSAAKKWQHLAEQPDAQSDATKEAEVRKWRLRTKEYSRAWYEYTVAAGLPSDRAKALCISASGFEDVCRVK
ncbi:MAG: hypothetical protein ACI9MC_001625 [Kiritimatiellia bacterium]|jgi:hypothetical protein